MTRAEFVAFALHNGFPPQLVERAVQPCSCDWSECGGWKIELSRMTEEDMQLFRLVIELEMTEEDMQLFRLVIELENEKLL